MRSKNATALLDHVFYALSDPTRRDILAVLSKGEAKVTELADRSDLSLPAISKHLKVLERGRLITRKADKSDGRVSLLSLRPNPLETATDWLEKHRGFWNERFNALEKFLETHPKKEKPHGSE